MIAIEVTGLQALQQKLNQLGAVISATGPLLASMGAEAESQTRRRITDEKTAPDGTPWDPWSRDYAASRHGGNSLLEGEGDLVDSIGFEVNGGQVEIGTNLVYGAIHQLGGKDVNIHIPARPYLGVSAENEADLLAILDQWANQLVHA